METPWPYFVVLVVLKTWFDVWEDARYPRTEHPRAAGPAA
jgi:hypothetical protein